MKETKQQKKERLQGIKKGSKEYNELSGNEKKSWNAYDRRKFVEGNKFISKEKRANIELWNEKISKKTGLEEIKPNVDLAFQRQAMPDTFEAIDNISEQGVQIEQQDFTHLNDFFKEVDLLESTGNKLKFGDLTGDEAREKIIEKFNKEGGKVWVDYEVKNGKIILSQIGKYIKDKGMFVKVVV